MSKEFIHGDLTYDIIGACFEVYKEKGCGFVEPVYQECLEIELGLRGISFIAQKQLNLSYKGQALRSKYQPDLICREQVIVELKAVSCLLDEPRAQLQNYLKATGMTLGLLVNFGHFPKMEIERIVSDKGRYIREGQ